MSRLQAGAAAALLLATQAGCITVTIETRVLPDGSVERVLATSPHSVEVARATAERFAPPWRVAFTSNGEGVRAEVRVEAGTSFEPNEAGLRVAWRDYGLFTRYRYEEDFGQVRIGKAAPAIAPRPPARMPLLAAIPVLMHERNVAALERRARESLRTHLAVEMPGTVTAGNFDARDGSGRLVWEFNFRAPAAPWAESRVWHPGRIALLAGVAAALGAWLLVRRRAPRA